MALAVALAAVALTYGPARAGGGSEHALLVVDPASQEAMYVANHYRAARGIPERNVLYMPPGNEDYAALAGFQLAALRHEIARRGLDGHIDYVVLAPGRSFYVPAAGLVGNVTGSEEEAAPRRFSLSAAYTLAFLSEAVLAGNKRASSTNHFYSTSDAPAHFDARVAYRNGAPSTHGAAERYFIAFQLGYTGERGNTVDDLVRMIDRGVAADGSRPAGTFYLMQTDDVRSTPRHPHFAAVVRAIGDRGGAAEVIYKVDDEVQLLPRGRHDALGVMTGHAAPGVEAADMTLAAGAFGDHLTSFAATFDVGGQEKLSRWIAKGASASMGTVEEPYVYGAGTTGKFPHPRLFVWYLQGMSMGESLFRAHQWAPFQGLFYGDPLVRPFATAPQVDVPDAPDAADGPVTGTIELLPVASTRLEGRDIAALDVLVDGARLAGAGPGEAVSLRTELLPDGAHDLRVLAYDDSPVRNQGRWVGLLETDNAGRAVDAAVEPMRGDLDTEFQVRLTARGAPAPREVQLWQNGRVLAAADGPQAVFRVPGRALGAGIVELRGVALFHAGRPAVSRSVALGIHYTAATPAPPGEPPTAFGYTAYVPAWQPSLLDLPALARFAPARQVVSEPAAASLSRAGDAFLLSPAPDARGTDTLQFVAAGGGFTSTVATVTLRYCLPLAILRQPRTVSACPGAGAAFSVAAEGADLTYQWYRDGVAVAGANGPSLSLPAVGAADGGEFQVEVFSWCGNQPAEHDLSAAARLVVKSVADCRPTLFLPLLANR